MMQRGGMHCFFPQGLQAASCLHLIKLPSKVRMPPRGTSSSHSNWRPRKPTNVHLQTVDLVLQVATDPALMLQQSFRLSQSEFEGQIDHARGARGGLQLLHGSGLPAQTGCVQRGAQNMLPGRAHMSCHYGVDRPACSSRIVRLQLPADPG